MNCKTIDPLLSSYVDGELGGKEMRLVREHLNTCSVCAQELDIVRQLKLDVIAIPDATCDEGLEERLVLAVMGERKSQQNRGRLAFAGGLAFVGAFAVATVWLQSAKMKETEATNQVARSSFELARDQAYFAGSDPLAGNTVVLTSSHGRR